MPTTEDLGFGRFAGARQKHRHARERHGSLNRGSAIAMVDDWNARFNPSSFMAYQDAFKARETEERQQSPTSFSLIGKLFDVFEGDRIPSNSELEELITFVLSIERSGRLSPDGERVLTSGQRLLMTVRDIIREKNRDGLVQDVFRFLRMGAPQGLQAQLPDGLTERTKSVACDIQTVVKAAFLSEEFRQAVASLVQMLSTMATELVSTDLRENKGFQADEGLGAARAAEPTSFRKDLSSIREEEIGKTSRPSHWAVPEDEWADFNTRDKGDNRYFESQQGHDSDESIRSAQAPKNGTRVPIHHVTDVTEDTPHHLEEGNADWENENDGGRYDDYGGREDPYSKTATAVAEQAAEAGMPQVEAAANKASEVITKAKDRFNRGEAPLVKKLYEKLEQQMSTIGLGQATQDQKIDAFSRQFTDMLRKLHANESYETRTALQSLTGIVNEFIFERDTDVSIDPSFKVSLEKLKVLMERFSGKGSLTQLINYFDKMKTSTMSHDKESWILARDSVELFRRAISDRRFAYDSNLPSKISRIANRVMSQPSGLDSPLGAMGEFQRILTQFIVGFKRDRLTMRLLNDMGTLGSSLFLDSDGMPTLKTGFVRDISKVLLPAIWSDLQRIPIPRIESMTPEFDIVVENIQLHLDELAPSLMELQLINKALISLRPGVMGQQPPSQHGIRMTLFKIQGSFTDVPFFLRKKTFPRLADWGVASAVIGGDGMTIQADLAVNVERGVSRRTLVPQRIVVTVDTIDVGVVASRNDELYLLLKPILTKELRRVITSEIGKQLLTLIDRLDEQLTPLKESLYKLPRGATAATKSAAASRSGRGSGDGTGLEEIFPKSMAKELGTRLLKESYLGELWKNVSQLINEAKGLLADE